MRERSGNHKINSPENSLGVTLADVARRAGVSITTVSAALGGPGRISPERQAKIQTLAQEMGYHPRLAAKLLRARMTGQYGLLVGGGSADEIAIGGFWGPILAQFVACCEQQEQAYHIEFYQPPAPEAEPLPKQCAARLVDGVLVAGEINRRLRGWLAEQHEYPWISLDEPGPHAVISSTDEGIYEAARHLAALGHRQIAYLGGPRDYTVHRLGDEGFSRAAQEFDYSSPDAWRLYASIRRIHDGSREHLEMARAVLGGVERPTAVICQSMVSARAVIHVAQGMGLRVPQDLSVVSYGVGMDAEQSFPALTTVEPDFHGLVEHALAMLRDLLAGRTVEPSTVQIRPNLVLRESVARR